ncbi:M24 family metallopeptidase [Granulicella cerasi]|uniref:M24 family metallopeptidase n=1 Tax=Granulicella cerasi TaxID=741063 RepID=A0ABW1Z492_9BACT|nr:Xaa-Pro peptidase family protein [Granulicella cerasi]
MRFAERRKRALATAAFEGLDGLLVTHGADVRWLSGFTGSSGAVALRKGSPAVLFTDGRYTTQAKAEAAGMRVVIGKGSPGLLATRWLTERAARKVGFDAAQTSVAEFETFRKAVPAEVRRGFFVAKAEFVAKLREVKDADEIAKMRSAAALGCKVFNENLEALLTGAESEAEFALRLEAAAKRGGAEAMSFDTIVAGGERSALPHGRASAAKLPKRGFVTVDFGVVLDGYCSDMTRTVFRGKASRREREVYDSVLEAQVAAVNAVRAGVTCGEIDEAARSVLRKAKLDKWFTHSTGHGVGLEIHEGPRVAAHQKQQLVEGMVITIEPGVYLPGEFGMRIEDTVVVNHDGCEVITSGSPKVWTQR